MPRYRIRYVHGPNSELLVTDWEEVSAESVAQALALRSPWPVQENMAATSAWAKNPGTSLYHVEAWEAELAD